jgi:hypothetical protein
MTVFLIIFCGLMLAGAWDVCTRGGEKEGICCYGYKTEEENENENLR